MRESPIASRVRPGRWALLAAALFLLLAFAVTACSTPPAGPGGDPPPGGEEPPPGGEEPPPGGEEPPPGGEEPANVGPATWTMLPPSLEPRQEVAFLHVNGRFYLAGGSERHERYDPATESWEDLEELPQWRDHVQAVAVGDLIYYIGGLAGSPMGPQDDVYVYDTVNDSFETGTPIPDGGRGAGGIAVHDGRIYYAGGVGTSGVTDRFDVYDPEAGTWESLDPMPHAREHFQAAVLDDRLYAIGGRAGGINATLPEVDVYDFGTRTWTTLDTELPTPRGGFATAVVRDEILVFGGEGHGNAYDTVEAYHPASDSWRTITPPMPVGRHGIQAAVCNETVYIAAGGTTQGGGDPTNVFQAFSFGDPSHCPGPLDTFVDIEWQQLGDAPFAKAESQGFQQGDRLFVFGGFKFVGEDGNSSWNAYCTSREGYVLDTSTTPMEWDETAPLPAAGEGGGYWTHGEFAVDGNLVHMAGMRVQPGRTSDDETDCEDEVEFGTAEVWTFDTVSETWANVLPDLPAARSSGGLARVGRSLHFFGGTNEDTSDESADHWALDLDAPETGWQDRADFPEARNHVGVTTLDGLIYAVGGQLGTGDGNVPQNHAHRYDPATDTWEELPPLPVAQSHVAPTIAIGGRIFVFGGEQVSNGNQVADVWAYDPSARQWINGVTPLPMAGRSGVVGFFGGDIIYSYGEFQSDVYAGTLVPTP